MTGTSGLKNQAQLREIESLKGVYLATYKGRALPRTFSKWEHNLTCGARAKPLSLILGRKRDGESRSCGNRHGPTKENKRGFFSREEARDL